MESYGMLLERESLQVWWWSCYCYLTLTGSEHAAADLEAAGGLLRFKCCSQSIDGQNVLGQMFGRRSAQQVLMLLQVSYWWRPRPLWKSKTLGSLKRPWTAWDGTRSRWCCAMDVPTPKNSGCTRTLQIFTWRCLRYNKE